MPKTSQKDLLLISKSQEMMIALRDHIDIFKLPLVDYTQLGLQIEECIKIHYEIVAINSALTAAFIAKKKAVNLLKDSYAKDKLYCEGIAGDDESILLMAGLSGKKKRSSPKAPTQCTNFKVLKQGLESSELIWDNPVRGEGGREKVFRIYKSEDGKTWILEAAPTTNKVKIKNQESGKTFFYFVVSANNKGESPPSNMVTIKF